MAMTIRVLFADYLVRQRGTAPIRGGQAVQFVQDRATFRDFQGGALDRTDNPLDLAITGEGFFVVDTQRGERFTRAGRFSLAPYGRIVDGQGNALQGRGGRPLVVPMAASQVVVRGDGTVVTPEGPVGQVRLVRFADTQRLRAEGAHHYASDVPPEDVPGPAIVQGALEHSNVSPILETTRMMEELRDFQFASQLVEAEGDRQRSAIDRILRRAT